MNAPTVVPEARYAVSVDGSGSLADMIRAGNYDIVDANIYQARFSGDSRKGKETVDIQLLSPKGNPPALPEDSQSLTVPGVWGRGQIPMFPGETLVGGMVSGQQVEYGRNDQERSNAKDECWHRQGAILEPNGGIFARRAVRL
jgi:hypothetical protein